jgi:hypothetical protein
VQNVCSLARTFSKDDRTAASTERRSFVTLPDDDLESIADANDAHGNVGTRGRRGAKRGSGMPAFKGEDGKLRRLFAADKARTTRKRNKATLDTGRTA